MNMFTQSLAQRRPAPVANPDDTSGAATESLAGGQTEDAPINTDYEPSGIGTESLAADATITANTSNDNIVKTEGDGGSAFVDNKGTESLASDIVSEGKKVDPVEGTTMSADTAPTAELSADGTPAAATQEAAPDATQEIKEELAQDANQSESTQTETSQDATQQGEQSAETIQAADATQTEAMQEANQEATQETPAAVTQELNQDADQSADASQTSEQSADTSQDVEQVALTQIEQELEANLAQAEQSIEQLEAGATQEATQVADQSAEQTSDTSIAIESSSGLTTQTGVAPAPVAEPTQTAEPVQSGSQLWTRRPSSSKAHLTLSRLDAMRKHDRKVGELHQKLNDHQMIDSFSGVIAQYNMSEPLAAAFRATPGFKIAVESFPNTEIYNIVPEHRSSQQNIAGLESLIEADTSTVGDIKSKAREVVFAFDDILAGLPGTISNLKKQITEDTAELDALDIGEEVLSTLSVNTVSHAGFTSALSKLEEHLQTIDAFNVDDLKAYPDKIKDEIDGISALVDDLGGVVGMQTGQYGLVDGDKSAEYEPSPGDFGGKDITKAGLVFYLGKALSILNSLQSIVDRRDELSAAVQSAASDMPEALNSDDTTYGCIEHVTLLTCYTTMVSKLIRESIVMVSMLLSTVDSVLDIDPGTDD